MSTAELSAIRSRYLGVDKKKRQIRKMSDRKFVFDWSEQDDTFSSDSPSAVGGARQGAAVMFGRGHLAGMDADAAHAAHATMPSGARIGSGDRKKGVVDERHWSEKPLSEMKERDWRIFREDFSITARGTLFLSGGALKLIRILQGGQIPFPLRSWEESAIPAPLLDVIATIGYKEPSPIQRQAIPIGLQNRDLIGIAETGEH
jgi:ATP-dependent RNA helicase DDX23/PRP28